MRFRAFVRLARPHFLLGGALMFAVGALGAGVLDPKAYIVGQFAVSTSQLTAHFANEYFDADADGLVVNRTWFSGGSGVLVEDPALRKKALRAGLVTTGLALGSTGLLALDRPAAAAIALSTIAVSWLYSMPPVRLLSTGWGEAAASLVVAVAVPLVGALTQRSSVPTVLWWVVASLFFVHLGMILALEVPDLDTDRIAGKRVLAVRFGREATIRLMTTSYLAGFTIALLASVVVAPGIAWMVLGLPAAITTSMSTSSGRFVLLTTSAVASFVLAGTGALMSGVT